MEEIKVSYYFLLLFWKKFEADHLKRIFGNWFSLLSHIKLEVLLQTFDTENRCVIRLMR